MTSTYEVAPLELIVAPEGLDGSDGRYRMTANDGKTDLDAVKQWVDAADVVVTQGARRGLAEKLMNWAYGVRAKPLSSFDWDDFNAFFRFLVRPEPREAWCSGMRAPRDSPKWRPLVAPVSPHYRFQLARHLSSLISYLADARHANLSFRHSSRDATEVPMAAEPGQLKEGGATKVEELPKSLWQHIEAVLDQVTKTERLIVYLLYFCGLSAPEVSRLDGSAFVRKRGARLPTALRVTRSYGVVVLSLPTFLHRLIAAEAQAQGGWAVYARVTKIVRLKPTAVLAAAAGVLRKAARAAELRGDEGVADALRGYTPLSLRLAGKAYQTRSVPMTERSYVEEALDQSLFTASGKNPDSQAFWQACVEHFAQPEKKPQSGANHRA